MRTFELDVQAVKLRILRMAQKENLDSAVLVAAMADVLGLSAATLDLRGTPQEIDTRIGSFVERVKQEHRRVMLTAAARSRTG